MRMDLSDLKSVADFVNRFKEQYTRLDILVNNAGLNTKVARVVNLSSTMHHMGQADFKLSAFSAYTPAMLLSGCSYYSDSKLFMNLLTMEINRRYDFDRQYEGAGKFEAKREGDEKNERPLISLCANPGAVHSDIWRNSVLTSFNFVMKWLFLDVDQGSATSVYAATVSLSELRRYQQEHAKMLGTVKLGDNFQFCSDLPCFIPYAMPAQPSLAYETMGAFAGPSFARVSFPCAAAIQGLSAEECDSPSKLAQRLWEYSAQLCEAHMNVSVEQ
eukprot:gene25044-31454_t